MAEIINYYNIHGNVIGEGNRKDILKNQETTARQSLTEVTVTSILKGETEIPKENFAVRSIMMFLFDLKKNMYVVKRSDDKAENPGLWDKSAGGHVVSGDSYDKTALKELGEELGVQGTIVTNENDLIEKIQSEDLKNKAILLKIDEIKNFISKRTTLTEGDFWYKLFNVGLYIGFYDGNVQFVDQEAIDKKFISIQELEQEIINNPNIYTEDILKIFRGYNIFEKITNISSKIDHLLK